MKPTLESGKSKPRFSPTPPPKSDFVYTDYGLIPHPDLYVHDHLPQGTGVLDSEGKEIVRQPRPVGFLWSELEK